MTKMQKLIEKNGRGRGCLVGVDGNAFSLMSYTQKRLIKAGWPSADIETVLTEARSGDYNNLICILDSCLEE